MTNEEKILEMMDYKPWMSVVDMDIKSREKYFDLLQMAEWKDKQCPTEDVIRKVLDIVYDHQYVDRDGIHNFKFEVEKVIEYWND